MAQSTKRTQECEYTVPPRRIQTVANGNSIELNASPCQGFLGRLAQVVS